MHPAIDSGPGSQNEVWAFDVSTIWHHRGLPPVGITRTEFEYARYVCRHHPETLLTVYDRQSQIHLILPKSEAEEILGFRDESEKSLVRAGAVSAPTNATLAPVPETGTARLRFRAKSSLLLGALALLPPKSAAGARLRNHILGMLASRGGWRSGGVRGAVERWLLAHPSRAEPVDFSRIDRYISVGCGWDLNNLEAIYHQKKRHGFAVTTCLYDLVPLVMPDVVAPRLSELFPPYLCNLLWASDSVACISESTKNDLDAFIQATGAPRPELEVCHLGSAPLGPDPGSRPAVADRLAGRPFALYVATFEPRKNHEFLHFLWNELVRRRNVAPIPLVLAGRRGWRTADLLERMQLNTRLCPEHLVLAEGLADAEIAWLYRNCRFTVLPSLYEGWGLPVSESLFHGRFCIASDNSSLREVGQGLIRNIDLLDGREWMAEIERCIADDGYLRAREASIAREFKARSWEESSADFFSLVSRSGRSTETEDRLRSPCAA